jgi:pilus assembly protein CpaB
MDRRHRHLVVLGVAIVTATAASVGVYRAVTRVPVREVEVPRTFAVVATRSLPPGVRLTSEDVRLTPWPAGSPLEGSFSEIEQVVNRALLASVVENEPLVQAKLASPDAGAGLSPAIPAGMRAMAVRVNEVIGVAGFLDPGARVDVLVTIRNRDESTSKTVVSNLQVLGAGTRTQQEQQREREDSATPPAAVVTLLVTPDDAERIALAQAEGQIVLALRNPLDTEPTQTSGIRTAALLASPAPPVAPPPPPAARPRRPPAPAPAPAPVVEPVAAPKPYMVEAIRAAKRTEEEVVQEVAR